MRAHTVLTGEIQCGNSVKTAQKETTVQKVHPIQLRVQRKFYFMEGKTRTDQL